MQNCSIHSIWPAHHNLLNLHPLRNQNYHKVSTFPCDMYLAPHCTSSFTRAKNSFKIPPPPLQILGSLCLWWGSGHSVSGMVTNLWAGKLRNHVWILNRSKRAFSYPEQTNKICCPTSILFNGYEELNPWR